MKALAIAKSVDIDKTLKSLINELEEECLRVVSLIEALKIKNLTVLQREEILGELSAVLSHLKIHSQEVEHVIDEEARKE
jgi:NTP pyrophosphatase (non-canonical NTP hydrolase)